MTVVPGRLGFALWARPGPTRVGSHAGGRSKRRANAKRLANRELILAGLPTHWLLPTGQRSRCRSYRLPEAALISPAVIPLAVDENGRRAFDAVRDAALHVPFHTLGELVCLHRLEIGARVHAGGRRAVLEVG